MKAQNLLLQSSLNPFAAETPLVTTATEKLFGSPSLVASVVIKFSINSLCGVNVNSEAHWSATIATTRNLRNNIMTESKWTQLRGDCRVNGLKSWFLYTSINQIKPQIQSRSLRRMHSFLSNVLWTGLTYEETGNPRHTTQWEAFPFFQHGTAPNHCTIEKNINQIHFKLSYCIFDGTKHHKIYCFVVFCCLWVASIITHQLVHLRSTVWLSG